MKVHRYVLTLLATSIFALSSCAKKSPVNITKEEFVSLANKTKEQTFSHAYAHCTGRVTVDSSKEIVVQDSDEKLDRTFIYNYNHTYSRWFEGSSKEDGTPNEPEKTAGEKAFGFIKKNLRDLLKEEPLNNVTDSDAAGIYFFKKPLSIIEVGFYVNAPITNGGLNGILTGFFKNTKQFNNKNGFITCYQEESYCEVEYQRPDINSTFLVTQDVSITIKITYE